MRIRTCLGAVAVAAVAVSPQLAGNPAQAAVAPAVVTVVHAIPKTPVDVYLDGKLALNDFSFGTVTKPISLAPGSYSVAIRPHKASAMTKPILATTLKLSAGENASVVADLNAKGTPSLNAFVNPTGSLAMGDARVIIRHLADAPAVDVYAGKTKVVSDLANPHQASLVVPAGKLSIKVDVAGTTTTVIGPAKFVFKAGTTTVVYAIGNASAKSLTVAVESYS